MDSCSAVTENFMYAMYLHSMEQTDESAGFLKQSGKFFPDDRSGYIQGG